MKAFKLFHSTRTTGGFFQAFKFRSCYHYITITTIILLTSFLLLPTIIFPQTEVAGYNSPFEVISSTEDEIVLRWTLPDYKLVPVERNDQLFHHITGDFAHYFSKEGHPRLPYVSENIGIPVDGDIQLFLSNTEETKVSNLIIYPAEKTVVKDGGSFTDYNPYGESLPERIELSTEFYQDRTAYRRRSGFPENRLQKGVTAFAGDRHFASFIFSPFQYNGGSQELTIITEATITIRITGNKTKVRNFSGNRSYIDRAGSLFFLNDDHSKYWRNPKDRYENAEKYRNLRNDINTGIVEIRFIVDKEGIYRVTYQDIVEHLQLWQEEYGYEIDLDLRKLDPRYWELSSQYGVTPIHIEGERTGTFNRGDYIEFFGQRNFGKNGYSDTYTAENVYTLKISDNWGARMAVESGGIRENNPRNYIQPQSYEHTVHFEEQNTYSSLNSWYFYPGRSREDLWFWKVIRAPDLSVTPFKLEYPHDTFMRGIKANVSLVGSTDTGSPVPDHHARVRVNSAFIGAEKWSGQREQIFANDQFVSNQYLQHGTNYLYIDLPGDTPAGNMEALFLDYFNITYWREYKTESDYIKFTKPSNRPLGLYNFKLEGFSTNNVSIYKVNASLIENAQIEPFSETGAAPYTVTFQDVLISHDTEYIAVANDRKMTPKFIKPRFPSNLKNPDNAADYIIVTIRDYMDIEGTQILRDLWSSRGYLVKVIDVQNIFDEFNFGVRSAEAMKDFFHYAYNNWSVPMTDVLLLGKGIFDERDHSVHRNVNHIPYKNVWTWKLGATPSDNWFACIVGDDLVPDFNISRITAWTEEQVLAVANKSLHYKENPNYNDLWQSKVTLVAGGQAGADEDIFAQQNEAIRRRWIPEDYDVLRVYSAVSDLPDAYRGGTFRLRDSWNQGTSFIQFMGHGGGRIWADYNLLNNRDIATLNNSNFPFVNSLSCYPADFSRPGVGSIGENMVLTEGRGAIAHFGFTGLGYLAQDLDVGYHLNEAIFNRKLSKFGDIASFTKAKTYSTLWGVTNPQIALVESAILFGDPMLGFNLPQDRVHVELNTYNATQGDTIVVTAEMGTDIEYARIHIQDKYELIKNVPFDMPVINGIYQTSFIIEEDGDYKRIIKIYGYGDDRQVIGMTNLTVGSSAVADNRTIPAQPTASDSIHISARFFDTEGVVSVVCRAGNVTREMEQSIDDPSIFTTIDPFPPFSPAISDGITYSFVITNGLDQQIESQNFTFRVFAPDLSLHHLELASYENRPAIKALVKNLGNHQSPATTLNVYKRVGLENTLLNDIEVPSLEPMQEKWFYAPIPAVRGSMRFRGHVNEDGSFVEPNPGNNIFTTNLHDLNMFYAGVADTTVYSLDDNLKVEIPANLFSEQEVFYINSMPFMEPLHQPDAHTIPLLDDNLSTTYQVGTFNTSLLEEYGGEFPANKRIRLTVNYSKDHPKTTDWQGRERFAFYRWEAEYQKWINQGGFTDTDNRLVFQDINRPAIYTILHNTDTTAPVIRANVQDQEFTFGGYISGNGVISLMLSDSNGIDLFDRDIVMFLNDREVSEDNYTIAANPENLTSVPIKYQLNLDAGTYTLFISCSDINGNFQEHRINFVVSTKFDIINLANYPNPVVTNSIDPNNANRTRFTYVLTDDADDVKIKVYTVSGRLVRTLDNLPTGVGYHEYPRTIHAWDCRDDKGVLLANGIYFYKVVATKNDRTVERIQKMAIAR